MISRLFLSGLVRGGSHAAAFLLSFLATCWLVRKQLPFPEVPVVRPKIDHLAENRERYDTLFLGSSRIHNQVLPLLFDRLAAQRGLATKSFNAGVSGLNPPEDGFLLDQFLATHPKNLKWVFIELDRVQTRLDPAKAGTIRAVYWHDWPRFQLICERAFSLSAKKRKGRGGFLKALHARWEEPVTHCMEHLRLFLRNETNSGRGAEMLGARLRINGAIDRATPLDKELEGWSATGRPQTLSGRERLDYEAALARFRAQPPSRETVDPVSRKALETMLEKIEQLGATPVLIVPPTINKRCFLPSPEREKKTLVLNFCDFEKFPELYETRHRLDTEHLNEAGSGLFTEALVKMWADAVHGP